MHINRPVDLPNWHEFDYSSIARNFLREGANIFYPRIDWRGDGPGFTEMEYPVIPWIMSGLYSLFGIHEIIGRLLSLTFTLGSLWIFRRLARRLLPEPAALAAMLFFIFSHEVVIVATAIQPESLMLLCYLLAIYFFVDWYDSQRWVSYWLAVFSFALAILIKSPAAHLAIFFFIWAIYRDGMKAFAKAWLYVFALLSFAPAIFWYAHAASLWLHYHNSMGVSNEDHWLGVDLFRRPKVIANLLLIDLVGLCGVGGAVVAAAAVLKNRLTTTVNRVAIIWLVAVAIYLIVILRTAAGYWASYYHVVAVAPLALLFGAGVYQFRTNQILLWIALPAAALIAAILWLNGHDATHMPGVLQDFAAAHSSLPVLLGLAALAAAVTVVCCATNAVPAKGSSLISIIVVAGCFTYFFLSGQMMLGTWKTFKTRTPQYDSAMTLRDSVGPEGTLIVATGGICVDPGGRRVAQDAPSMFYWLDRKGFTTCEGRLTLAKLESDAQRGARYFVAEKTSLDAQPGLEAELRKSFTLVVTTPTTLVFKLTS